MKNIDSYEKFTNNLNESVKFDLEDPDDLNWVPGFKKKVENFKIGNPITVVAVSGVFTEEMSDLVFELSDGASYRFQTDYPSGPPGRYKGEAKVKSNREHKEIRLDPDKFMEMMSDHGDIAFLKAIEVLYYGKDKKKEKELIA